jgi:antirestriction protein ArdC
MAKKKKSSKEGQEKICNMVNDKFVAHIEAMITLIENGEKPKWIKPWDCLSSSDSPMNIASKTQYKGWNIFSLSIEAMVKGYEHNLWLTVRQASEAHEDFKEWKTVGKRKIAVDAEGQMVKPIKEDEYGKTTPVTFWKFLKFVEEDEKTGDSKMKKIPMLRYFQVYNVAQCQGINHIIPKIEDKPERTFNPIEKASQIIADMKNAPELGHGGDQAFYSPSNDSVQMPKPEQFKTSEQYYGTLFHEFAHATGHKDRLDRDCFKTHSGFGSYDYGREELVAELASAILCGECGIIDTTMANSVEYLKSWIKTIKEDSKILIVAASRAQAAADCIQNVEPKVYEDDKVKAKDKEKAEDKSLVQA